MISTLVGNLHQCPHDDRPNDDHAYHHGEQLPTTLGTDESNGGLGVQMTFRRVIVWPDGREEVEGVTPKALPPPDPTPGATDA